MKNILHYKMRILDWFAHSCLMIRRIFSVQKIQDIRTNENNLVKLLRRKECQSQSVATLGATPVVFDSLNKEYLKYKIK